MSNYSPTAEHGELEATLGGPTSWLVREIKNVTEAQPQYAPPAGADVTIYAKIDSATHSSVVEVTKWKTADIYAYADDPLIDLLNVFSTLLHQCQMIGRAADLADHELKTLELWTKLRTLNNFLTISPKHDELIATLSMLPRSSLGMIDSAKLSALESVFSILESAFGLTDEHLDRVADILERAGFDLQAPIDFSEVSE